MAALVLACVALTVSLTMLGAAGFAAWTVRRRFSAMKPPSPRSPT